jgi:hypothetical protein
VTQSAFGQGWEAKRNNQPASSNPFDQTDWHWEEFLDGWYAFKPTTPGSWETETGLSTGEIQAQFREES